MTRRHRLAVVLALVCGCSSGSRATPTTCPSLDLYCAGSGVGCVRSWSTAEQAITWCVRGDDGGARGAGVFIEPDCNGFNLVVLGATDTSTFYVYDPGTGQLVGIGIGGSWTCVAGQLPATPFPLSCGDGPVAPLCGS